MSMGIKCVEAWLKNHPRLKEWVWFVVLWLFGLLTVALLSYPLKWLVSIAT